MAPENPFVSRSSYLETNTDLLSPEKNFFIGPIPYIPFSL